MTAAIEIKSDAQILVEWAQENWVPSVYDSGQDYLSRKWNEALEYATTWAEKYKSADWYGMILDSTDGFIQYPDVHDLKLRMMGD